MDFNRGWTFCKKGGPARELTLPHDAMIEERRTADSSGGNANGYFPGGVYIYEKRFTLPKELANKRIIIQFEGVYKDSKVTINGKDAGGKPYGYIPFFVETDGLLNDGENLIQVIADNDDQPTGRWYTGAGIYRHVWLWVGGHSHIEPEGIRVSTFSISPPRIKVEVAHNSSNSDMRFVIRHSGDAVAEGSGNGTVIEIPDAKLWSDETPELYECAVTLTENGIIADEAAVNFGIRTV
jgi:beta-galactosidase/beta-glucuronidase